MGKGKKGKKEKRKREERKDKINESNWSKQEIRRKGKKMTLKEKINYRKAIKDYVTKSQDYN
jgi:hypothetical protein